MSQKQGRHMTPPSITVFRTNPAGLHPTLAIFPSVPLYNLLHLYREPFPRRLFSLFASLFFEMCFFRCIQRGRDLRSSFLALTSWLPFCFFPSVYGVELALEEKGPALSLPSFKNTSHPEMRPTPFIYFTVGSCLPSIPSPPRGPLVPQWSHRTFLHATHFPSFTAAPAVFDLNTDHVESAPC